MKIAAIFLVLAMLCAVVGFGLAIAVVTDVAKLLFYAFIVAFLYFFVRHVTRTTT